MGFLWLGRHCLSGSQGENDCFDCRDVDPIFDFYPSVVIATNTFLKEPPETAKVFLPVLSRGCTYVAAHPEEAAEILMTAAPALRSHEQMIIESQKYLAKEYISDTRRWGEIDSVRRSRCYFPPIPAIKTDFFLSNIAPYPVSPFGLRDDKYRCFPFIPYF